MDPNLKLSKDKGKSLSEKEATCYKRLIERRLYLQISRPNVCFAVHKLSQFLQHPTTIHLDVAHHLLRYLKQSHGQGILIKPVTISFSILY